MPRNSIVHNIPLSTTFKNKQLFSILLNQSDFIVKKRRFELRKKKGLKSSVHTIALVDKPAIEKGFIYLHKDGKLKGDVEFAVDKERRILFAPVLIPDKDIPRVDDNGEEYMVFFTQETVQEAAHDYMAAGTLVTAFNSMHDKYEKLDGVTAVENWTIEGEKDKAYHFGMDVPIGTWMQGIKITNDEVWGRVKRGDYTGVSIEARFDDYEVKMSKPINNQNSIKMNKIKKAVDAIFKFAEEEETKMEAVENQEYVLEDGRKIVVTGEVETMEAPEEEEMSAEDKAKAEAAKEDAPEDKGTAELAEIMLKGFKKFGEKISSMEQKFSKLEEGKEESVTKFNSNAAKENFDKLDNFLSN